MITPNTIQLYQGELIIVGDPNIPANAISIKPTTDNKRIWGRINDINYSFLKEAITSAKIFIKPTDKLWHDLRVTIPVTRYDIALLEDIVVPQNFQATAVSTSEIDLTWDIAPGPNVRTVNIEG